MSRARPHYVEKNEAIRDTHIKSGILFETISTFNSNIDIHLITLS